MGYDRDGNYTEDDASIQEQKPITNLSLKKGGDMIAKVDFSSKAVLYGGIAGFGYAILMGKSKILWTVVGAMGAALLTHSFKK